MKVVIDIPEILLDRIKSAKCVPDMYGSDIVNTVVCVRNSTPYAERPHGEWEQVGEMTYKCTKCGWLKKTGLMPFCENCGADMRKEGDTSEVD